MAGALLALLPEDHEGLPVVAVPEGVGAVQCLSFSE